MRNSLFSIILFIVVILYALFHPASMSMQVGPQLLTDPFLQLPTATSVRVVWFTEFAGTQHLVSYGEHLELHTLATTTQLSRTREDQHSRINHPKPLIADTKPWDRAIWRHEAEITGLTPDRPMLYQVMSQREDRRSVTSASFTLRPNPSPGRPLKILLTSDHQLKPMVAANLQKVQETIGQVDAIFFAGDLVNVPDRASEWFDDAAGGAFFPALQGRANYALTKNGKTTRYKGGELIQHAPLFAAIGNHEVMGRLSRKNLNDQFNDAVPRPARLSSLPAAAALPSAQISLRRQSIKDQSFNTDTYEEIFALPDVSPGGKQYYAITFGDIRLIVLYATNMWRSPSLNPDSRGKYRERAVDSETLDRWGHGQLIFAPIAKGTPQYAWLEQELKGSEFQQAKYKVVMFHHPPHSLGENVVPAYTDPIAILRKNGAGQVEQVLYEYPKANDYLIRDVVPLLEKSGVQLVFYGHSHLWNRFVSPEGMHFLETSNVGNSYGAYLGEKTRQVPTDAVFSKNFGQRLLFPDDYAATGNPNGLPPVMPTIAPLIENGQPLPYIASNDITVFSVFETGTGKITSYRFDTREPNSQVIEFDQFELKPIK